MKQDVHKNHANKFLWKSQAKRVLEIAMEEMTTNEELLLMETSTVVNALKSYNVRHASSSGTSSGSGRTNSNNTSSGSANDDSSNVDKKRKMKSSVNEDTQQSPLKRQTSPSRWSSFAEMFSSFKKAGLLSASVGAGLCMESHVQELLALSDIMLLKPSQYSQLTRKHFGNDVLKEAHEGMCNMLLDEGAEFGEGASIISDIVFALIKKKLTRKEAVRKLVAMTDGKAEAQASVLIGLSNLVQKLPHVTLMEGTTQGETELWSSAFDPILSALIADPDRNVFLRWSNVIPSEGSASEAIRMQPDAIVCEIDQMTWGQSLGHGEVKLAESTRNVDALARDLVRLAILNKEAIEKSNLSAAIAFQINGWNMTIYITKKIPGTAIFAMTEVLSFKFPKSLEELDMFTTKANLQTLVQLHQVFWSNCTGKEEVETMTASTALDIATLNAIKQATCDRTRSCSLRF